MISIAPLKIKTIHIIGIGGIGMSGIANVLSHLGYTLQGSDLKDNNNIRRLRKKGMRIYLGHLAHHIDDHVDVVVYSSAVSQSNPELKEALERRIPVISRAEMLSELMRFYLTVAISGTHGKTTTTSLVGQVMASFSPTIINGGIINHLGSNVETGAGDWMVVEADESDGTFVRVPATVAVVTNIDPEHLDFYGSFEALKKNFVKFIEGVAFYGFAVVCYDHPVVREIIQTIKETKIYTYGFDEAASACAVNVIEQKAGLFFDLKLDPKLYPDYPEIIKDFFVPLHGKHNVLNTLAAVVVGLKMSLAPDHIKKRLLEFQGVQRRFTEVGVYKGARFIDDYAHHPTEIQVVLQAARSLTDKRVFVVFQPHRYSRLQAFFSHFLEVLSGADGVFVMPVYPAGESFNPHFNEKTFIEAFQPSSALFVELVDSKKALAESLRNLVEIEDMVLFLGAGDITKWAHDIFKALGQEKK